MNRKPISRMLPMLVCSALALSLFAAAATAADWPTNLPSRPADDKAPLEALAAAAAGSVVVTVGRHGHVLISDNGRRFSQSERVPTRTTLTSVHFADARNGWAVGHDGVVLNTRDGGRRWTLQREAYGSDEVLLGVAFENPKRGIAVGLFGLMLETSDGGITWNRRSLDEASDRHLYSVVRVGSTGFIVTAEGGRVLRSVDSGDSWQLIQTGVKASLWAGAADGNRVVAGGLRGTAVMSSDAGITWRRLASGTTSAITAAAYATDGRLYLGTANGMILESSDEGRTFSSTKLRGTDVVTALAPMGSGLLVFPRPRTLAGEAK